MTAVKWIKIMTDIFDDEKILLIESLPSADSIIVIWFKLLTLAGKQNNDGVFLFNDRIPYTDEMLATIFRRDINVVRLALQTFADFGMIEVIDNVITIPNWNKHQTLDAYDKKKERDRLYQQERRAKQKLLVEKSSDKSSDMSSDSHAMQSSDVAISEEDKEEDIDIDIDTTTKGRALSAEVAESVNPHINYQSIADMYNDICASLPKVRNLSESRKKAIRARLNTYSVEDLKEAFELVESSDFLKGSNNRNWTADFDWIMKDSNICKILDGKYNNKTDKKSHSEEISPEAQAYLDMVMGGRTDA